MKTRLLTVAALLFAVAGVASAHRLDEYLQAILISVDKEHVQGSMRLIPGVSVASSVIANIGTNNDGVISKSEERAYAERVLADLSLRIDGKGLKPKLVSVGFPQIEQMREGLGEIHVEFTADVPLGGPNRRLILENHHARRDAAYLVNCLLPRDPDIHVVAQSRNAQQSIYELDYVQSGVTAGTASLGWWRRVRGWMSAAGFGSLFRLGMRHIGEGTDHLLFLLALLLPAPLMVSGSRWAGFAGVRSSVLRILKIVTAFTIGHSISLALAAFGIVRVPGRPIEVLIAVSILVSAIHALRPLFPGKEARIAAFFGLIHGLAFAATLTELGLGRWERVGGIMAFNLGIETMQMVVVAATMPSLVLMSRTRAYPVLRIGGALFAGVASTGWIAERLLNVHNSIDVVMAMIAHHAIWIAGALFLMSFICWLVNDVRDRQVMATAP
jgi:hypothetical protein